jgi:hypothetical protein
MNLTWSHPKIGPLEIFYDLIYFSIMLGWELKITSFISHLSFMANEPTMNNLSTMIYCARKPLPVLLLFLSLSIW